MASNAGGEPRPDEPVTAAVDEPICDDLVRSFVLTVIEGVAAGKSFTSTSDRCSVGSHALNELVIDDKTVSRFHCEIRLEARAPVIRDLGSRNRTVVDGLVVREAELRAGSLIRLGNSVLRYDLGQRNNRLHLAARTELGGLVGKSAAMRMTFAWLERAARSDVTVLLEGETGSGKGAAAAAIHASSSRKNGPLVVVDCTALPLNLLESELFGHERGAFTGAELRRIGAFEEADGGTIFLDEIGELPAELQPKLLRVLESREIRRVGSNALRQVNVRVIAASNRDLRAEVNAARFRSDLYFRLAVVKIALPPLRSRPEDLPLLVDSMLDRLGATPAQQIALRRPEVMAELARSAWPGNVRELRNFVERALLFPEEISGDPRPAVAPEPMPIDVAVPFADARNRAVADFERRYLEALLDAHHGRITAAAAAAGIGRVYVWKLMKKYGLTR